MKTKLFFVLFFGVILAGTLSALNSYAECDIQTNTTGDTSDDVLYIQKSDWAGNPNPYGPEKKSYHLKCDSNLGGSSTCKDKTQIVITKEAYIGNSFRDLNKISGGSIIKCKAGHMSLGAKVIDALTNDKWFQDGTINNLPPCDKNAPENTITVSGKTIHCARKEKRGDNEYCIGVKSGDICVESGNGKPAEKPKEEPKAQEKNQAEQQQSCDTGYEYNPISQSCVKKSEQKAEEAKAEKQPAKKAAAPKKKQNANAADAAAAGAAGAGAVAATTGALLSESNPAKDFNGCKSYVRMDVTAIQNGNTNSRRYIISSNDDDNLKKSYKNDYSEDLNAKSNPTNVRKFVDEYAQIYCDKFTSQSDAGSDASAAAPAASPENGAEQNNSQNDDLTKKLHAECKQVLDKYNETKQKLDNKSQGA